MNESTHEEEEEMSLAEAEAKLYLLKEELRSAEEMEEFDDAERLALEVEALESKLEVLRAKASNEEIKVEEEGSPVVEETPQEDVFEKEDPIEEKQEEANSEHE